MPWYLRRFTKKNVEHPTYKAFAELGKAIKTIFLRNQRRAERGRAMERRHGFRTAWSTLMIQKVLAQPHWALL